MLQPIVVRKADGSVILGQRRHRAASAAGIKRSTVEIDVDIVEAATMRLSEECSKSDIPDLERAEGLAWLCRLIDQRDGQTPTREELAKRVGITPRRVQFLLDLARVPEPVIHELSSGRQSANATTAVRISGARGLSDEEKIALARKVGTGIVGSDTNMVDEAIRFTKNARPAVREAFLKDREKTLKEAQQHQDKLDAQEDNRRRQQESEAYTGFDWPAYFDGMDAQIQRWTIGLRGARELASYVPLGRRRRLTHHLEQLINVCDEFIERMENDERDPTRDITERIARIADEHADLWN
jgi:ParB/RepB/Spo0J family partition protein